MRQRLRPIREWSLPFRWDQWYLHPDEYVLVKLDSFLPDSFLPGRPSRVVSAPRHSRRQTVTVSHLQFVAVSLPSDFLSSFVVKPSCLH